jgi:thiol-disulfide isomerase/thioredoxin
VKYLMTRAWALAAVAAAVLALTAPRAVVAAEDEAAATTADDAGKGGILKPGDDAPALSVDKWVKGEPVKKLEKGNVYVLEFWATWCGPCIQAIPHVTELQKKYADKKLVVIGMNVWENDVAAVEPFVKKMGAKMEYRVATDLVPAGAETGKMAETWMQAAGRDSIPCSFIVDREGKVAWIGHPMSMDEPLEQVIAGTFDLEKEAARAAKEAVAEEKAMRFRKRIGEAMEKEDWAAALTAVDEAITGDADNAEMYRPARLMILVQKKDYDAANKAGKELTAGDAGKDQQTLLNVANILLSADDPKKIDLDFVMASASAANDLGGDMAAPAKMLMAKAHAAKGEFDKAVELQTAAIAAAPERAKPQLQRDLDKYKSQAKGAEKPGDESKEGSEKKPAKEGDAKE